jgi:hypothetical protein
MMMHIELALKFVVLTTQVLWPPNQIGPTNGVIRMGIPLCF